MMTPSLFDALSQEDQAEILDQEATYVCTRQNERFLIDLYALEDFYVEVYYRRHDEGYASIHSYYSSDSGKREQKGQGLYAYTSPSTLPPVYRMSLKLKGTA